MKNQKRIITFFIFVGLFSASYFIGSLTEVSHEDALAFQEEFNNLIEDIDGLGIFLHNSVVALPMFIPGFGIAWGFFSSWQTGQAFAALALLNPIISEIHPLTILYASPFGIMELTAYSIAMSRSLLTVLKIIKKISLKPDLKIIGIEVGIVVGLLIAGGFLEAYMIDYAEEAGLILEI
ncbi:MAG TPA: stage II sporulation protein M [Nitrosopumilaceae archaeon]|nr:stage II sporulation protein M [Nitrosopumilaceae archaeon]